MVELLDLGNCVVMLPVGASSAPASLARVLTADRYREHVERIDYRDLGRRMNVVLDDHLLREVLIEREPSWIGRLRRAGQLSTTGSWYDRAVPRAARPGPRRVACCPIAALPPELRAGIIQRVATLPTSIQLFSMRELAWSASGFGRLYGLNLLAAEALGAATRDNARVLTPPTGREAG